MIRLLIGFGIRLLANAVGLLVADWALDDMSFTASAFFIAVAIFTVVEVIIDPLITKISLTSVPALRGSAALVTTLIGLVVTVLITDDMKIDGATTWIFATLIVWLAALVAAIILPLVLVKKTVDSRDAKS